MNAVLKGGDLPAVADLRKSIQDGITLVNLVEILGMYTVNSII